MRQFCSVQKALIAATLSETAALRQAELQLPGAQAALLLTMVEAHLETCDAAAGCRIEPCQSTLLSAQGPKLGPMDDLIWIAVGFLLPAAAACTVSLDDSRPHAVAKRCLLAALMKATVAGADRNAPRTAMSPFQMAGLQLALHFERLIVDEERQPQGRCQQYDPATALANCLCFFRAFADILPGNADAAEQLLLLQARILHRVAAAPCAVGSPWPLLLTAGAPTAYSLSSKSGTGQPRKATARYCIRRSVRQYLDSVGRLRREALLQTAPQLAALGDSLFRPSPLRLCRMLRQPGGSRLWRKTVVSRVPSCLRSWRCSRN